MKKLMAIMIMMVGMMAQANAGWSTHEYQNVLGGLSLDNVCLTESEIRTIEPVVVCSDYETSTVDYGEGDVREETNCIAKSKSMIVRSRAYNQSTCLEWGEDSLNENSLVCVKPGSQKAYLPNKIKVTRYEELGDVGTWPPAGKTAYYTIPNCQ